MVVFGLLRNSQLSSFLLDANICLIVGLLVPWSGGSRGLGVLRRVQPTHHVRAKCVHRAIPNAM